MIKISKRSKNSYWFSDQSENTDAIIQIIAKRLYSSYGMKLYDLIIFSEEFGNEGGFEDDIVFRGLYVKENEEFKIYRY